MGVIVLFDDRVRAWAIRHGVTGAALADLATLFAPPVRLPADGTSEQRIQAELRLEAARRGCALWRNNSGATTDDKGRTVRYGLANDSKRFNEKFKSSDLIGITPVTHAGFTFGVFTAVEVKRPGWRYTGTDREVGQNNFLTTVAGLGGIARFATGKDDVWPG